MNINNNKYTQISSEDMTLIRGGKKLDYIECIGQKDAEGRIVAYETMRHYNHNFLGKKWTSTSPDKPGDIGNC